MKQVAFFLLVLAASFQASYGQNANLPVDPDSKLIKYQEVVPEPGSADVLYDRGASWISNFYKSPSSVLRIQDKANGKIEGMGRMSLSYNDENGTHRDGGQVLYIIKMEFKQDKYRFTLTDFNLKATSRTPLEKWMNKNDPAYNPRWDLYLYQVDTTMQSLVKSMKEGMKPKEVKKDEW